MRFWRTTLVLAVFGVGWAFAVALAADADGPAQYAGKAEMRVGVFDSRVVALAFYRSEMHDRELELLADEHNKAKTAGDEKKAKELEARAEAGQKQAHRQTFGTASVDDILQRVKDELPKIAKRASVDVIVSKWAVAYSAPGAQFVDVTDQVVAPFEPDAKTKGIIRQIRDVAPVSAEEIEKHHEH